MVSNLDLRTYPWLARLPAGCRLWSGLVLNDDPDWQSFGVDNVEVHPDRLDVYATVFRQVEYTSPDERLSVTTDERRRSLQFAIPLGPVSTEGFEETKYRARVRDKDGRLVSWVEGEFSDDPTLTGVMVVYREGDNFNVQLPDGCWRRIFVETRLHGENPGKVYFVSWGGFL